MIVDPDQIEQLAIKEEDDVKVLYNTDDTKAAIEKLNCGNKIIALLCAEIGGANSMEPLVVGNFTNAYSNSYT